MHLIQLLLPIRDNSGKPFPRTHFDEIRGALTNQFGGVTAFLRAPAEGLWEEGKGQVAKDDIVILEVMADTLDREWWGAYRKRLEAHFQQEEVVIRASMMERL
jgi:hypothetical protein